MSHVSCFHGCDIISQVQDDICVHLSNRISVNQWKSYSLISFADWKKELPYQQLACQMKGAQPPKVCWRRKHTHTHTHTHTPKISTNKQESSLTRGQSRGAVCLNASNLSWSHRNNPNWNLLTVLIIIYPWFHWPIACAYQLKKKKVSAACLLVMWWHKS